MAYYNNKAQEKARYLAVTEVRNGRSVAQVACGLSRRIGRSRYSALLSFNYSRTSLRYLCH